MSAALLPATPPAPTVPALRARLRDGKAALIERFRASRPTAPAATRLIRGLARHVDGTLLHLWQHALMPKGAALVAVGGYGRGELFPYSDVDVLVLLPATHGDAHDNDALKSTIGGFITACWDIGLEIGSSVRTIDECVAESERDVTVQTALLEARFLCGSRRVFDEFRRAHLAALDPAAFLRAKTLEMHQRHTKYEDTPYSLEPNCKESPGGLRDLQTVIWIARAARLGKTWTALAANGMVTPFEVKQLQRNEGLLKLIRARLHMVAGRREDRLVFDLQTAVAESFGYQSTRERRASEALMRRYYWAAKAVAQLNQILMLNIEEQIQGTGKSPMRPINDKFLDRGGMLEVVSDDLYQRDPHAILETFVTYQQTVGMKGLSARTLRALYNSRDVMNGAFRRDPVNRALFMQILINPTGRQTHAFRLMNQTSVLGRHLWVFRRIVGQMQHDLFHVYTVDQHILMVLRNVRRFFIAEHAHEYPFCSQLGAQFERPWVLYVAALFHDVAKGRGGDHSDLGGVEVRRFCRDHGIAREDAQLIEFLVREHLTMSRIAQKEDLSDAEVIETFATKVKDPRTLTALYLLTVADIRGTSPKVWNAWKGKLLEDLYRATLRALGGAKPNVAAELEARKQEALHVLNLYSLLPGVQQPLWDTLELSYFVRHDAADIAWHARSLYRHVDTRIPVVRARLSSVGEGLQVLVYAPDRPDLFARICGYFDSAGFNILDAKIHTTTIGYALDTFQVISQHVEQYVDVAYRDLISLVEIQLSEALAADGPLPEPSRGRLSRRVKSFPVTPRVLLKPDERAQRWLLSVSASDRSGLLYAIARVLARHQLNLQLAKVTTLGERVEDTFLINGASLQQNRQQIAIETELLDAIAP
ncbi:[protein-PII] uridylyltransferase [Methylibium petroleiphilum]|uniref:Bifunctional uridylyltransferase/uridylyl-removing enzyme n=1 Tax=Methylibium petroleiphilum (strain ATCC BAA-1232 / LMG 22953 / PM1) TaxID=420662 RepID=A2SGM9_METPP|nr:[protein-PII] uridylyltransferase [Methylibium petroleiphilum]ABM94718.1 (PII) uridylyltransferase [Methylibium petroleiphilum PM1]